MSSPSQKVYLASNIEEVIPKELQQLVRWVTWRAGESDERGKFSKVPVDPVTGRTSSALDHTNWRTFSNAIKAVRSGQANGIGIVLDGQVPVELDGKSYTLTAVDLDHCSDHLEEHGLVFSTLPPTYREVSPSLCGIRIIGLSRQAVRGGNAKQGRELYCTKRYVTITGFKGEGQLADITDGVIELEQQWFPARSATPVTLAPDHGGNGFRDENVPNMRIVLDMLDHLSSDTDYEAWRNICWSIASTGWQSANAIAHKWSAAALNRYDADVLDQLLAEYDPTRGITIGTLVHQARSHGWKGTLAWKSAQPSTETSASIEQSSCSQLMTVQQLRSLPRAEYVVRGVLPAKGLAAIFGAPGSGKSFLALDLAHAIAAERADWFGHASKQAPVLYIALEGQAGIARRTLALEQHTSVAFPNTLRFKFDGVSMLEPETVTSLAAVVTDQLGKGSVLFIDTLNQSAPGADENSSQDMGRIIENAKQLAASIDGLVVFVHHSGKDSSKGLRGHSSLNAALDAVVEVKKTAAGREWAMTKAKDDIGDQVHDFELVPYQVDKDEFGPITSCAIRQTINTRNVKVAKPTGKHQIRALNLLSPLLSMGELTRDQAIRHVAPQLDTNSRASERATEAISGLIERGHLLEDDRGYISIPSALPNPNPIGGFGFSGTRATPKLPVSGNSGGHTAVQLTTSENLHV